MNAAKNINPMGSVEPIQASESLLILPSVRAQISKILNNPMVSMNEMEKILRLDQVVVAKIIRAAAEKSADKEFNFTKAIRTLGIGNILALIEEPVDHSTIADEKALHGNWRCALSTAIASELVAVRIKSKNVNEAYVGGLLHDIGHTLLLASNRDRLKSTEQLAFEKKISFFEAELEQSLLPHTQIGVELAKAWKFPVSIQNVIEYHHEPMTYKRGKISDSVNQIVDIVLLADIIVKAHAEETSGTRKPLALPRSLLHRLFMSETMLFDVQRELRTALSKAEDTFEKMLVAKN